MVTGHSLGAAVSSLAAIDIKLLFGHVDYFYNFASPRVGND